MRLRDSLPAITQVVLAAVAAFLLAQALLNQSSPLIAAIIPIASLGFVGDARPFRVLETAIAMTFGIVLAEALLVWLGSSVWVFALALGLTLVLARFVSAKAAFAISAAVQCTLVMLGPVPPGGPFIRTVDALIGGVVAIVATAIVPRNPWGTAVRVGRRLFHRHAEVLVRLAAALRVADVVKSAAALELARQSSSQSDDFSDAVDSGRAIARVSPWYWPRRADFARLESMVLPADLATRNLRVIARRSDYLVGLGQPEPELATLLEQVAVAIDQLTDSIADVTLRPVAQAQFIDIAHRLRASDLIGDDASAHEGNVIWATRSYVIDALCATGMTVDEARSELAPTD